jgi:hypothetical protein
MKEKRHIDDDTKKITAEKIKWKRPPVDGDYQDQIMHLTHIGDALMCFD